MRDGISWTFESAPDPTLLVFVLTQEQRLDSWERYLDKNPDAVKSLTVKFPGVNIYGRDRPGKTGSVPFSLVGT